MNDRYLPPEGWTEPDANGRITYTEHGYPPFAPKRGGYKPIFVARHGMDYTTWIYRPIGEQRMSEQTWDTQSLQEDFEVLGFQAPFVVVRRKSDGVVGSLLFQHMPRVYWGFRADK